MSEEDDSAFKVGDRIGDYEVVSVLGFGATGTVYLTQHTILKKLFAVKVLSSDLSFMPEFVRVFQHEAQIVAALTHENIVPVHNFGECNGYYYYVMDFVNGGTLEDVRRRNGGRLKPEVAIDLMTAVARGLAYAHRYGVVHRDLKPENVLLTRAGVPQITDFGMAHVDRKLIEGRRRLAEQRRARTGAAERLRHIIAPHEAAEAPDETLVESQTQIAIEETATDRPEVEGGTEGYMAPEVARGNAPTTRADVYALGALLHFLLVGETPRAPGEISPEITKLHNKPLEELLARSISASPASRYPTAQEFLNALERVGSAPARHRRTAFVAATAVIALAAISIIFSLGRKAQLREENARVVDTAREFFMIDDMRKKLIEGGHELHTGDGHESAVPPRSASAGKTGAGTTASAEAGTASASNGASAAKVAKSDSGTTGASDGNASANGKSSAKKSDGKVAGETTGTTKKIWSKDEDTRAIANAVRTHSYSEATEREYWEHFCEERTGRQRFSVDFGANGAVVPKLAAGKTAATCALTVPAGTYNIYLRSDGETPKSLIPMRVSVGADQVSRVVQFSGMEDPGDLQFFSVITVAVDASIVRVEIPDGANVKLPKVGITAVELRPTFNASDFSRMFGEFLSALSEQDRK